MKKVAKNQTTIYDMIKKKTQNQKCYYCKTRESEEKCIYCTECRLKMAKKEIEPNYGKPDKHYCQICKEEITGPNQISHVICRKCLDEI